MFDNQTPTPRPAGTPAPQPPVAPRPAAPQPMGPRPMTPAPAPRPMGEPEDIFAGIGNSQAPRTPQSLIPTEKTGKGKKILLVILIVVIIILLGVGAVLAYFNFIAQPQVQPDDNLNIINNTNDTLPPPEDYINENMNVNDNLNLNLNTNENLNLNENLNVNDNLNLNENLNANLNTNVNTGLDSDNDGLTDEQEINLGTDPQNSDTDGDGLLDKEEIDVYNTNPLNPDTDGDTYNDGEEIRNGYNPNGPGLLPAPPTS